MPSVSRRIVTPAASVAGEGRIGAREHIASESAAMPRKTRTRSARMPAIVDPRIQQLIEWTAEFDRTRSQPSLQLVAGLLEDARRRRVAGKRQGEHAQQAETLERLAGDQRQRFGDDAP